MGGTTSSSVDWAAYSSSSATRSTTFGTSGFAKSASGAVKPEYHPSKISVRESRNSAANPASTPVILALDCTGSMQDLAVSALKNIGTLMKEIYDKKPISDPHVMAMFYDDVITSPTDALQATQFESDMIIIDQLQELKFIGHGGGNRSESSDLPLHFAINKCECDAFAEGRKGFLFTIGDDGVPPGLSVKQLKAIYGDDFEVTEDVNYATLLEQAEENWHVFNIVPVRGNAARYSDIIQSWRNVLGERTIVLEDIEKLAEVIVATMQVIAGADKAAVAAGFSDPGTSLVVSKAIKDLSPSSHGSGGGVVRL